MAGYGRRQVEVVFHLGLLRWQRSPWYKIIQKRSILCQQPKVANSSNWALFVADFRAGLVICKQDSGSCMNDSVNCWAEKIRCGWVSHVVETACHQKLFVFLDELTLTGLFASTQASYNVYSRNHGSAAEET